MLIVPPGQRGQALVGVLVVMVILFALAGAVAIGASTLLLRRGPTASYTADFQVRSAVNDSVAQVAGSITQCGAAPVLSSPSPTPAPTPTPTPSATPLNLTLPPVPPGLAAIALCTREVAVVPGSLQPHSVVSWQPACFSVPLGQANAKQVAVFFNARSAGSGGIAYVDKKQSCTLPSSCSTSFNGSSGTVVQVALSCPVQPTDTLSVHVNGVQQSLKTVFTAQQDPSGQSPTGSLYLIAAETKVASPNHEELLYFVQSNPAVNQLLYEAPMPS